MIIRIAFPNIHMLTRSYTSDVPRSRVADPSDLTTHARSHLLKDRRWRSVRGPEPVTGEARWSRGDLGALACTVVRTEGTLTHLFARDGTPLGILRGDASLGQDRSDIV